VVRNWIPAGLSVFLAVACTATGDSAPTGFVEGHLKIVAPREVELSGGQTPSIAPEVYAEYPLIVRSSDGKTEVARVTADANGNFRTALPPGDYVLDVQGRAPGRVRAQPRRFSVASGQTARVDMDIDTGVR
jgi:Carboxypeptidase regulatory-like domain